MSEAPKMAPVQGFSAGIPWEMHLRAYDAYCKKYGRQEALITGGCRGGFGTGELDMFIPGWRDELSMLTKLRGEVTRLARGWQDCNAQLNIMTNRAKNLDALINSPETVDWIKGVELEAAHQIQRWPAENDAGKTPLDWFWLIGYLAQKAASSAMAGDDEKAKHHTISTGAALLNWHRRLTGEDGTMRPGIDGQAVTDETIAPHNPAEGSADE